MDAAHVPRAAIRAARERERASVRERGMKKANKIET
jgi:hypothetical protein